MQSNREAEGSLHRLPGVSNQDEENDDLRSHPDLIPLQPLQKPVSLNSDSILSNPWLDDIDKPHESSARTQTTADDDEKSDVLPEWRPRLRRATMHVRRLSISSNPEVGQGAGQLQLPDLQRAVSPTHLDDEDIFGLNSRRRSSAQKRIRRRKTSVSLRPPEPFPIKVPAPDEQPEEDSDAWSTHASGYSTSSQPTVYGGTILESNDDDGGAAKPKGHLRRFATEGNLKLPTYRQRRASLGLWKDKSTSLLCPKSSVAEATTTHVDVYVSAGASPRPIDIPSWIADIKREMSADEVGSRKSTELDTEESKIQHSEIVHTEQGAYQVTWANIERRYSATDPDIDIEPPPEKPSASSVRHNTGLTDLARMNHNMSSWVWTGETQDPTEAAVGATSIVPQRPLIHLFPRNPQAYFDVRIEQSEDGEATPRPGGLSGGWVLDDTSAIATPRPDSSSNFDWTSRDSSLITPPADGPKRDRLSVPRQGKQNPESTIVKQQSLDLTSLSVPSNLMRHRTLSNLASGSTHFRKHRDSVELTHHRILRFGGTAPEVVIHRDSIALAKRRIKNRPRGSMSIADVVPGSNVTSLSADDIVEAGEDAN